MLFLKTLKKFAFGVFSGLSLYLEKGRYPNSNEKHMPCIIKVHLLLFLPLNRLCTVDWYRDLYLNPFHAARNIFIFFLIYFLNSFLKIFYQEC